MIAVQGSIQTGSYEKDGVKRSTFEIVADNVSFCGSKNESGAGAPRATENAAASFSNGSVDDFAAAFIRLEGGIILDFRIAWAMHVDTPGDTIIFGKKGALRIPSTECWNGSVGGEMTLYSDVAGAQVETKFPIIGDGEFGGLFYKKIRSFLDAIKNNEPAPVPTSQILYNQAIIDGIVKSNAVGHEIAIELPEI
jgi:predicted dehydrogenase